MQFLAKVIALAVFQLQINGAASTASFLPINFAFWFWQNSIVVGEWLYIDGGEIWARWNSLSDDASPVWNQQTIAIGLSSSWNTASVDTAIIVSNKTTAQSPARLPDLYYDPTKDTIYALGGDTYEINGGDYNTSVPIELWGFKPGDGNADWELEEAGTAQDFPLTSNVAGGLTATSPAGHYNLGGYITFGPDYAVEQMALTDMVDFNFANQSWYNQTTSGQHFLFGQAQYIPTFGQDGVILFFGGKWPSDTSTGGSSSVSRLDTIVVYDIHSNTFFQQPATNAPQGRFLFCSVAAGTNASANSSYEIFIYGGTTGNSPDDATQSELSTVYILTLPAFNWLPAPVEASTWRSYHTCSIIGNRQMISIAGYQDEGAATWTDPWTNGLGIFDLTALEWTNAYDHTAAPYEPSSLVTDYYAKNARYPKSWADPALQAIFQANVTTSTSTATPSIATPSTAAPSTATSSSGSSSTGAIVGGVVGGIAGLAIIGFLIFLFRRNRRRSGRSSGRETQAPVELHANLEPKVELPTKSESQTAPFLIHEAPGSGPAVYELPAAG